MVVRNIEGVEGYRNGFDFTSVLDRVTESYKDVFSIFSRRLVIDADVRGVDDGQGG